MKEGSCHLKLEGRAREQWPSAKGPNQLQVTLLTRIQRNPYPQRPLSFLLVLGGVLHWSNPTEARGHRSLEGVCRAQPPGAEGRLEKDVEQVREPGGHYAQKCAVQWIEGFQVLRGL